MPAVEAGFQPGGQRADSQQGAKSSADRLQLLAGSGRQDAVLYGSQDGRRYTEH